MSLGQLEEEKGSSIFQFSGNNILKGTKAFNSIPHFAFKILHSYPKTIGGWSYTCFSVFEALQ